MLHYKLQKKRSVNGITIYRNGPERTGTYRNGPERTETDFCGYRNVLFEYRNGLSGYRNGPERTETDRNGPKRTFLDTETYFFSTETDSLGTETDQNGPKRTFVNTETDSVNAKVDAPCAANNPSSK